MSKPIIRIFPHSKEFFEDPDQLRTWLHTTMRLRGGWYRIKKLKGVGLGKNPPGSIVMFRKDDRIVGEAIVKKDVILISDKGYEGKIAFEPSSIRIYREPLGIGDLEKITGLNLKSARPYYLIESSFYPDIMKKIVKNGFF